MSVRREPLTDEAIAALQPGNELGDASFPGLRVRASSPGLLSWSFSVIDTAGRKRCFTLGNRLSLAEARNAAQELHRRVRDGYDRIGEKEPNNASPERSATLGSIVQSYYATGPGAGFKAKRESERGISCVFARLLDRPASALERAEVQLVADTHPAASSGAVAISALRQILSWAERRGLVGALNWRELKRPISATRKEGAQEPGRHLSPDEIRILWPLFVADETGFGALARIALYTAARRRELTGATWGEFKLEAGVWHLPATRRKRTGVIRRNNAASHEDLVIPLPRQAIILLYTLRLARLERTGVVKDSDPVFADRAFGRISDSTHWLTRLKNRVTAAGHEPLPPWSLQSLRRSTALMAVECGIPRRTIKALLGYRVSCPLQGRYENHRLRAEHRAALQAVADRIDRIIAGNVPS